MVIFHSYVSLPEGTVNVEYGYNPNLWFIIDVPSCLHQREQSWGIFDKP